MRTRLVREGERRGARRHLLPSSRIVAAAAVVVFAICTLILPNRSAEIERARIGDGTRSRAGDPADDCARTGVAGKRADCSAGAGADKAAGYCAITLCCAAS